MKLASLLPCMALLLLCLNAPWNTFADPVSEKTPTTVGHFEGSHIVISDVWYNRVRSLVIGLSGKTPEVGGVISAILEALWPAKGVSIWDQIKIQVAKLIDEKTLEKETELIDAELRTVREAFEKYGWAKVSEKSDLLTIAINRCEDLFNQLSRSSNKEALLPYLVTTATIHVTALREMVLHEGELFPTRNLRSTRLDEMVKTLDKYDTYLNGILPAWKAWRKTFITASYGTKQVLFTACVGAVEDSITKMSRNWYRNICSIKNNYQANVEAAVSQMLQQAVATELIPLISPVFSLHGLLPDVNSPQTKPLPAYQTVMIGPISNRILGQSNKSGKSADPPAANKHTTSSVVGLNWGVGERINGFMFTTANAPPSPSGSEGWFGRYTELKTVNGRGYTLVAADSFSISMYPDDIDSIGEIELGWSDGNSIRVQGNKYKGGNKYSIQSPLYWDKKPLYRLTWAQTTEEFTGQGTIWLQFSFSE